MNLRFDLPKTTSSIIKVIGVGGGGGNAVNHMYRQGITGVDFIVCNTDAQALEQSPIPNKIQLGPSLTEGMGAGAIPEVGRNSAIETIDSVKEMLGTNTRMLFITAGMGGGTGTGASPIIAQAAKELDILTVAIVTTPFAFEGRRRKLQAEAGLEELKKYVDAYLVISNDRMREIFGNLTLGLAFSEADEILSTAAKGIAEIITVPGYINVDFKDVKTVMKDSGVAIMGSHAASGENRALKAVEGALASPLLKDNEIEGARFILLNISSAKQNEVTMDEITTITDYIQDQAGLSADVIWGNCIDDTLEDNLSVTIIATGFQTKEERVQQKNDEKVFRNLDEEKEAPKNTPRVVTLGNEIPVITPTPRPKNTVKPNQNPNQPSLFQTEPYLAEDKIVHHLEEEEKPKVKEEIEPLRMVIAQSEVNINEEVEAKPVMDHQSINTAATATVEPTPEPMSTPLVEEKLKASELTNSQISEQRSRLEKRLLTMKSDNNQSLNSANSDDLIRLENEPAYRRKATTPPDVPHSSESNLSRFSIFQNDKGKSELRSNNSFLHDNID